MGMAYLYGNGGSGSGGVLIVTAPQEATVTVSKDDRTIMKSVGTDGTAKFSSLNGGEWTVTISDGEHTSSRTVTINIDHAVTMEFFEATITVSYPEGSLCTCYYADDQTLQYNSTTDENDAGSATFIVPKEGTWVITCTDGIDTAETEVSITTAGQTVSVDLQYHAYLYKNGKDYTTLTGGWSDGGWTGTGSGYQYSKGSVTVGANSVTITSGGWNSDTTTNTYYRTINKLKLNAYSKLTINVSSFAGDTHVDFEGWDGAYIVVMSSSDLSYGVANANASTQIKSTGIITVDLSSITSSTTTYYIAIFCAGANVTFTEVYLD